MCNTRIAKYATPKISPSLPNACGTASEAISMAAIAASRITRVRPSSVFAVLPSHAYPDQANQSTERIANPSTSRIQDGRAATKPGHLGDREHEHEVKE